MLISLHMPKTAGNSFRTALESAFGDSLRLDYSDMSKIQEYLSGNVLAENLTEHLSVELSPNLRCIHGHFLPAKFLPFKNRYAMQFITWLRNPVDRLFSHYNFFRRSYDPKAAGPLFRRIIEENWSLERFCFCEEYRNLYGKYLWNFPWDNLDFVGLTEFYEDDLEFFSKRFLGTKVEALRLNCAVNGDSDNNAIDSGFRREVENFHSEDMALYNRALHDRSLRT